MAEPGNDSGDDFSVAVLTDQHMRSGPAVPERNHQLLGMPEGQNDGPFLTIQRIHRLIAALLKPHGASNPADDQGSERRQQRELDPVLDPLFYRNSYEIFFIHRQSPNTIDRMLKIAVQQGRSK